MEFKDIFITPIYLILIYAIAYWTRPLFTNRLTKKYYIPALTVKLLGAISLGLIYQFYYGKGNPTGDTFNYFSGSKQLNKLLLSEPISLAWDVFLKSTETHAPSTTFLLSNVYWHSSPTEFFIIKLGAILGILSFNTYTVTATLFALISFTGIWAMYKTFIKLYPNLYKEFALACFYLPSVFFWGSGLLKDSITIGALGWLFYGFYKAFIEKENISKAVLITLLAGYTIYSIKIYVLLAFLPPALFWIFTENSQKIQNKTLRILARPIFIIIGILASFIGATQLTKGDAKYDLDKITETTKITSTYLTSYVENGSTYNIGIFDGTLSSILTVGPQAIVVSLYRPFIWEVRSPIMLLSAIEASFFIYLTLTLIIKAGIKNFIKRITATPIITFTVVFSIILAFAVGTNSGNFGTLVRYKIPIMPFYLSALYMIQSKSKTKKLEKKIKAQEANRLILTI